MPFDSCPFRRRRKNYLGASRSTVIEAVLRAAVDADGWYCGLATSSYDDVRARELRDAEFAISQLTTLASVLGATQVPAALRRGASAGGAP